MRDGGDLGVKQGSPPAQTKLSWAAGTEADPKGLSFSDSPGMVQGSVRGGQRGALRLGAVGGLSGLQPGLAESSSPENPRRIPDLRTTPVAADQLSAYYSLRVTWAPRNPCPLHDSCPATPPRPRSGTA